MQNSLDKEHVCYVLENSTEYDSIVREGSLALITSLSAKQLELSRDNFDKGTIHYKVVKRTNFWFENWFWKPSSCFCSNSRTIILWTLSVNFRYPTFGWFAENFGTFGEGTGQSILNKTIIEAAGCLTSTPMGWPEHQVPSSFAHVSNYMTVSNQHNID